MEKAHIIAVSGDQIAADIIGLALIKHFGKARDVTGKSVWEQRHIQLAIELGPGVKEAAPILLRSKTLKAGDTDFSRLLSSVKEYAFSQTF
ncbi:MAG: hypothetical protein HYT78_10880 [Deltaproteobacteria bacterium]|nr:hypothetical protein [Deltaproteobacteria bacterium]